MKIRLFIKPYCGWCHKAQRWLDAHGVKYETLDVIADREAFDEMIELSGQTSKSGGEPDRRAISLNRAKRSKTWTLN